jgi:hypothetical protein
MIRFPTASRPETLCGGALALAAAVTAAMVTASSAYADDAPTGLVVGPNIHLNAQFEAGISLNPWTQYGGGLNFGQLSTGNNNQFQLNQVLLTASRALDPKNTNFDWGFKIQFLYGSDARYLHFFGELDKSINDRYQVTFIEADVQLHLPVLTDGGVDFKVGQFPSQLGYETVDPSSSPFYSHSYIYAFANPSGSTGAQATWHINPIYDLYLGIDTGSGTTFGTNHGDENSAPAYMAGIGLNLLDGKLTAVAATHFGPEDSGYVVPSPNSKFRWFGDLIVTYKPDDTWTFVTEASLVREDYFKATAFGVAQYAGYALSDTVTLNGRAEIFRDDKGFFVAAFPGNLDWVNAPFGRPNTSYGVGAATYSEFTVGATWKPAGLPAPIAGLLVRPELRYDQTLTSTHAYQLGHSRNSGEFAIDGILQF